MTDFRAIDVGAVRLRVAVEGSGPLVLMVHGWPESWYSWRHQLPALAAAGYTAAAIDVRGYGGSDRPEAIAAYSMEALVADVAGAAQVLQPDTPAILVGHDWGAPIVWNTALTRPEAVAAVAGLSVPYTGVPDRPFTDVFRHRFTDQGRFFYQEWFQQVGPPEEEAERDLRGYLRRVMVAISGDAKPGAWAEKPAGAALLDGIAAPETLPGWLDEADIDYLAGEFERSGMRGPLNRYRNHERDYAWLQAFKGRRIEQPALFIGGEHDPATFLFGFMADPIAAMARFVPNVEGHILPGCGHWTQQERPADVNALLLGWLDRLKAADTGR